MPLILSAAGRSFWRGRKGRPAPFRRLGSMGKEKRRVNDPPPKRDLTLSDYPWTELTGHRFVLLSGTSKNRAGPAAANSNSLTAWCNDGRAIHGAGGLF